MEDALQVLIMQVEDASKVAAIADKKEKVVSNNDIGFFNQMHGKFNCWQCGGKKGQIEKDCTMNNQEKQKMQH